MELRTHVGTQGDTHRNNTLTRSTGIGMASNSTGQNGVESTPYSGPCVWIMSGAVYFTITINAWGGWMSRAGKGQDQQISRQTACSANLLHTGGFLNLRKRATCQKNLRRALFHSCCSSAGNLRSDLPLVLSTPQLSFSCHWKAPTEKTRGLEIRTSTGYAVSSA